MTGTFPDQQPYQETGLIPTQSAYSLEIRAGADAFGDGSHPSTQGAMVALESLAHLQGFRRALDLGCGSGVLALQIAYQWHIPVLACDINEQAVAATRHNAEHNQLAPLITALRADGYAHEHIRNSAPYDLIACNWLAEPLYAHAGALAGHLAEEGLAVLSGMLKWQSHAVIEAHQQCGLTLLQQIKVGDWVCLLMQNDSQAEAVS